MISRHQTIIALLTTITLILSSGAFSQDSWNVEQVSRYRFLDARDVVVEGNYAYLAAYSGGLRIMDIRNPEEPREVSHCETEGWVYGVFISGDNAYLAAASGGLRIIDIRNPEEPREIGHFETPGTAADVFVIGNFAYVAATSLHIIDIRDPEHLFEVGNFGARRNALKVFVSGDYAYFITDDGLYIIDVSEPESPFQVGYYRAFSLRDVFVRDNLAYLATDSGLRILDTTDPEMLLTVGSMFFGEPVTDVLVLGFNAYLTIYPKGLCIVNIRDPESPSLVGYFNSFPEFYGKNLGVAISGRYAYVASGTAGLRIIDLWDLNEVGYYEEPGIPTDVFVTDYNYAYVVTDDGGLYTIDIINPEDPQKVGFDDTLIGSRSLFVTQDNWLYVATRNSGLRIIDICYPEIPQDVSNVPVNANRVFVSGNLAYLLTDRWLYILDVSNPAEPNIVGFYQGNFRGISVSGNFAFLAAIGNGLIILDISNPGSPQLVRQLETPGYVWNVAVKGDFAYLTCYSSGFRVIDISNPREPFEVGYAETPGHTTDLFVKDHYAYVVSENRGLSVIDIHEPEYPSVVGFYETSWWMRNVFVYDDLIYLPDGSQLRILRYIDPNNIDESPTIITDFQLHCPHPNPFNSQTQIRFDVPIASEVSVNVYDVRGRHIVTLGQGNWSVGSHSVVWDGAGLSAGVYLVKFTAGDYRQIRKAVLVK